jgi:hypothetical protein
VENQIPIPLPLSLTSTHDSRCSESAPGGMWHASTRSDRQRHSHRIRIGSGCPHGDSHNGTRGASVYILDAARATPRATAVWCTPRSRPPGRHCSTGVRQRTICGPTLPGRAWTAGLAEQIHQEIVLPWPAGAIISVTISGYGCSRSLLTAPCSLLSFALYCLLSVLCPLRSLSSAPCSLFCSLISDLVLSRTVF